MSADVEQDTNEKPATRTVMPPYLVLRDFLPIETVAGLLDYALAHEADFKPTGVGRTREDAVQSAIRSSLGTHEFGPFRPILKTKVSEQAPDLAARLGTRFPISPKFELQLVAHNDGAFYKRHIDTQTASDMQAIRVLSAVYYCHAEPKAFSGGALRLYAIGNPAQPTFIDIEPTHNSLLVFPSWAPHEVMPIDCPSKRFADSRFAVNCWVYRTKSEQALSARSRSLT